MKLLTLAQVIEKTTIGRSRIYSLMTDGKFPMPIKTGDRRVAWLESDVDQWIIDAFQNQLGRKIESAAA